MKKYSYKLGARTELVNFPKDTKNDYFERNNMKPVSTLMQEFFFSISMNGLS